MVLDRCQTKAGIEKITGGLCKLSIHSDDNGAYAYVFKSKHYPLFAPDVTIYQDPGGKDGEVRILFSYQHISVEMQKSGEVVRATQEIEEFLKECEKTGVFKVVYDSGTGSFHHTRT